MSGKAAKCEKASKQSPASVRRGDAVHHPQHGIGRVQSVRKRSFSGPDGAPFAQMYFKRDEVTLILPVDDVAETVRAPMDARQAKELLDHLENWNGRLSSQWKARAAASQEIMERGDPFEYAEVYKGLTRLEAKGGLRHSDRTHMTRSLDLLVDELSFALEKPPEQVLGLIQEATGA